MMEFSWDDFFSDLVKDLLNGVDLARIKERTKLSDNSLHCFGNRNKDNFPNLKQFGVLMDEAFKQRPENVRQAQKRICARFGMYAESIDALTQDVKRNNGGQ